LERNDDCSDSSGDPVRVIPIISIVLLLPLPDISHAEDKHPLKLSPEAIKLRDKVKQILPESDGWKITKVEENTAPEGWCTNDRSGINIVVRRSGKRDAKSARRRRSPEKELDTCSVYFLKHTWVGIHTDPNFIAIHANELRLYFTDTHKVFAYGPYPEVTYLRALDNNSMFEQSEKKQWEESMTAFRDILDATDKEVNGLLEKHCSTNKCRAAAARSLVFMKIPCATALTNCAMHGHHIVRRYCIDAIGYYRGKGSSELMKNLLEDPNTADDVISLAAGSLFNDIGKNAGPWIEKGLSRTNDMRTAGRLVELLIKADYKKAAPLVMKWVGKDSTINNRHIFIRALALFDHDGAREVVEKICEGESMYAEDVVHHKNSYMHISYERAEYVTAFECRNFLGPWGKPDKKVRVQLIPPRKVKVSEKIYFSFIFDNGSDYGINTPREWDIEYIVDGKDYPHKIPTPGFHTGPIELPGRHLQMRSSEFPSAFKKPGKHTVQCKWRFGEVLCNKKDIPTDRKPISGTVYSNVVEIEVVE